MTLHDTDITYAAIFPPSLPGFSARSDCFPIMHVMFVVLPVIPAIPSGS
jgi:hypothetical protein